MHSATNQIVQIRTAGPVTNLGTGEKTAVWPGDLVRVLSRTGSRRRCRVTFGHGEYISSFTALVPKRWLRFRKPETKGEQ